MQVSRFFPVSILGVLPLLANCVMDEGDFADGEPGSDDYELAVASEDDVVEADLEAQLPADELDAVDPTADGEAAEALAGASNIIRSVKAPHLCVDVPDYGRPPRNGDRLQVYRCHSGANQQFFFLSNGAIRTLWGGLCADVPDYGRPPQSGDRLQVFRCHGGVNQSFYLPGDGTIRSAWGHLCVDIPNFGRPPRNGDYLQLYRCHGGPNQRFTLN